MQADVARMFTEDEFVRFLDSGEVPEWYAWCESKVSPLSKGKKGSHNELIDLDNLTREYVIRVIYSLFGKSKVPKRLQAEITYEILKRATLFGLVIEQHLDPQTKSFVSTERLLRYWSKLFSGEEPPSTPSSELM